MLRNLAALCTFSLFSLTASAQVDPVEQLRQALTQQAANAFASSASTCLTPMVFSKSTGPTVISSGRQCVGAFAPKALVESLVRDSGLTYAYRNQFMDLILIPNGAVLMGTRITIPKGNMFYLVNYDDAGNVSEATAFNDAVQ